MKIVIATGIFAPEIGGPATYVPNIAKEFLNEGHSVSVITYSDVTTYNGDENFNFPIKRIKRTNTISNYFRYFKALFTMTKDADVIYSFDHLSAGIPSTVVNLIRRKKFFIRIGGDFIWERYLSITGEAVSLRDYYKKGIHKKDKIRFNIIRFVFSRATGLIFTTKFQSEIFAEYYKFSTEKVSYVQNPTPDVPSDVKYGKRNNDLIFAGRAIEKNNVLRLIESFINSNSEGFRLVVIGNGDVRSKAEEIVKSKNIGNIVFKDKVSRSELWNIFSTCHGAIFPSLTDISPNTMLDCISIGTPFVSSEEIGYDWIKDKIITFNPHDGTDMTQAINSIFDSEEYEKIKMNLNKVNYNYSFRDAYKDTLRIISGI